MKCNAVNGLKCARDRHAGNKLYQFSNGNAKREQDCRGGIPVEDGQLKFFVDPESGSLMTAVADDIDPHGFEHVLVFVDSGASSSVLQFDHCKDALIKETRIFTQWVRIRSRGRT